MLKLPSEIIRHYEQGAERGRLEKGGGYLELIRTQEIIERFLPRRQLDVLDVGGGPGVYSRWLARLGHNVTLIDPVPSHIKEARETTKRKSGEQFRARLGDARALAMPDCCADVVLMLGPLYHLARKRDRLTALREACRVLRPRGLLFGAAISRYASLIYGIKFLSIDDPVFLGILKKDLKNGQHRNPTGAKGYFTTAFFHHPKELSQEIKEAGLKLKGIFAVEGPAELLTDDMVERILRNQEKKSRLLGLLDAVETESSLMGLSSHILAVATV